MAIVVKQNSLIKSEMVVGSIPTLGHELILSLITKQNVMLSSSTQDNVSKGWEVGNGLSQH